MPMRRDRRRRTLVAAISAVLLAVAVVALARYSLQDNQIRQAADIHEGAVVTAISSAFDYRPTMLMVGDSFAGGTGDPKIETYPSLVAERMGWSLAMDAQGGTGYVQSLPDMVPPHLAFIDRLANDVSTYRADFVLIDGGRNDLGLLPDRVVEASAKYLDAVRMAWPKAKVVVILPSYITTEVASNYAAVSAGLLESAQRIGAYVIDPVAEGWWRDMELAPMLYEDQIHPSAEGNVYYADRIVAALHRMEVAP